MRGLILLVGLHASMSMAPPTGEPSSRRAVIQSTKMLRDRKREYMASINVAGEVPSLKT